MYVDTTEYIVVFKESATQEEIDKYANDVDSSGKQDRFLERHKN